MTIVDLINKSIRAHDRVLIVTQNRLQREPSQITYIMDAKYHDAAVRLMESGTQEEAILHFDLGLKKMCNVDMADLFICEISNVDASDLFNMTLVGIVSSVNNSVIMASTRRKILLQMHEGLKPKFDFYSESNFVLETRYALFNVKEMADELIRKHKSIIQDASSELNTRVGPLKGVKIQKAKDLKPSPIKKNNDEFKKRRPCSENE